MFEKKGYSARELLARPLRVEDSKDPFTLGIGCEHPANRSGYHTAPDGSESPVSDPPSPTSGNEFGGADMRVFSIVPIAAG